MNPGIAKLGHVELVTPNLEKSEWFFKDVIGLNEVQRESGRVYLRGDRDWEHHTLTLVEGEEATVDHIGWRTENPEDIEKFAEQLESTGIEVDYLEAGYERAQGEAIRFQLPSGQIFELYFDMSKPKPPAAERSRLRNRLHQRSGIISPERIDHVTFTVPDPYDAQSWLTDTLDFRLNEYVATGDTEYNGAWMSITPKDHDTAFVKDPERRHGQFHHVAYYYDSVHALLQAAELMYEHDITIDGGPGRHNVAKSNFLYVQDPGSGHRVELYTGGYLILEPDWEPIEWTEDDQIQVGDRKGMEVYGIPPSRETTPFREK